MNLLWMCCFFLLFSDSASSGVCSRLRPLVNTLERGWDTFSRPFGARLPQAYRVEDRANMQSVRSMSVNKGESMSRVDFSDHLTQDTRDFWWDPAYKKLLQERDNIRDMKRILDIGCGAGHWSRELSVFAARNAKIYGIDFDPKWIGVASKQSVPLRPDIEYIFKEASAYDIPYESESFDLVTCQTLLMHLKDPDVALKEMFRVLKPGGKILLVEPNNYVHIFRSNTAQKRLTLEERLMFVRLYALLEEGKIKAGAGDMGIAPFLPGMVERAGGVNVKFYRSDRVFRLTPPYEEESQKALKDLLLVFAKKGYIYLFTPEDAEKFFFCASGDKQLFQSLKAVAEKLNSYYVEMLDKGTLEGTFGGEMLITIADKKK